MAAPSRRRVAVRARTSRRRSPLATIGRVSAGAAGALVTWLGIMVATVPDVRPLATAPPRETAFMRLREREAHAEGRPSLRQYTFVPYDRIARTLKRAVLVAEDSGFWDHAGVEMEALRDSLEQSLAQGRIVRGGSTITQQLAKNLYLSPSKDPLRKLRELMITRRLEAVLSKRRILELYLNVVEWGDGTWGAEAASRHYFRKPASALSVPEAALLAGALINPNVYNPGNPPPRLRRRQQLIMRRMGMRDAPQPPAERERATQPAARDVTPPEPPPSEPAVTDDGIAPTSDVASEPEPPTTPTPTAVTPTP